MVGRMFCVEVISGSVIRLDGLKVLFKFIGRFY